MAVSPTMVPEGSRRPTFPPSGRKEPSAPAPRSRTIINIYYIRRQIVDYNSLEQHILKYLTHWMHVRVVPTDVPRLTVGIPPGFPAGIHRIDELGTQIRRGHPIPCPLSVLPAGLWNKPSSSLWLSDGRRRQKCVRGHGQQSTGIETASSGYWQPPWQVYVELRTGGSSGPLI
jgi:hypothetical protein